MTLHRHCTELIFGQSWNDSHNFRHTLVWPGIGSVQETELTFAFCENSKARKIIWKNCTRNSVFWNSSVFLHKKPTSLYMLSEICREAGKCSFGSSFLAWRPEAFCFDVCLMNAMPLMEQNVTPVETALMSPNQACWIPIPDFRIFQNMKFLAFFTKTSSTMSRGLVVFSFPFTPQKRQTSCCPL